MNKKNKSVEIMWEDYLKSIGENLGNTNKKYTSWCFCDNKKDANKLAGLVKQGIKKATAGLHYFYEVEGEKLPEVGDISIIENWDSIAQCIIETKQVKVIPFNEVDEKFANTEGEGDRSLKYWREAHIDFFTRELKSEGLQFSEDMLVVCQEFELVY